MTINGPCSLFVCARVKWSGGNNLSSNKKFWYRIWITIKLFRKTYFSGMWKHFRDLYFHLRFLGIYCYSIFLFLFLVALETNKDIGFNDVFEGLLTILISAKIVLKSHLNSGENTTLSKGKHFFQSRWQSYQEVYRKG